ncbi:MAG: hypothetical protein ACHQSE_15115 [Gemmatimonadales bacterium]
MNVRSARLAVLLCSTLATARASAQAGGADSAKSQTLAALRRVAGELVVVKTIPLQYLSNGDAARLVAPYAAPPFGATGDAAQAGVFEAGNAVHAITVRAPIAMFARIDSIVKANDRPPATLTLRLQVIAASDSAVHDGSIGDIDAELHNLFRFNGYRLLSQNAVWVNDGQMFSTTMRGPNGEQLTISGVVDGVRRDETRSVRLDVTLAHDARRSDMVGGAVQTATSRQTLLQTGLTIPIGQTVVVGSAMPGGSTPAIILTVRPELATKP